SWDINMMHYDDVVDQVIDRYQRLEELRLLLIHTRKTWDQLYSIISSTFKKFATDVFAYHEQGRKR
ncbi:MAG: hypothetical protein KAR20_01260, partial [Candidatus Heimdallarchaeota archaeon]|nr:hypothetical protein [Candidatus Heimdallarchaeota archaeon]